MKLNNKDFKRFNELGKLVKAGKATEAEKAEFAELQAKKNSKGSNDLAWWKNYPNLLKDVVNIPFNYIPGTAIKLYSGTNQVPIQFGQVLRLNVVQSIGLSEQDSDAFNTQMRALWLDMHRKYRGMGGYQKSDLGITIQSIGELFSAIAKFERIYGVLNTYKVSNRLIPYALFEALRIDKSLESNMADFRYNLNLIISKVQQLCLPKGISNYHSNIVTLSNVFKDSANKRSSLFVFDTEEYGVYDPELLSTGGCIKFKSYGDVMSGATPAGEAAFTLDNIISVLNEMLDALLNDDDVAKMCSDLIAAYGENGVETLSYIEENYSVEPIHDYERLLQMHNATIVGNVSSVFKTEELGDDDLQNIDETGCKHIIHQSNNVIIERLERTAIYGGNWYTTNGFVRRGSPATYLDRTAKADDLLFDTWVDEPGETEIMCGTRLTTLCSAVKSFEPGGTVQTQFYQDLAAFGTFIVRDIDMYFFSAETKNYQYMTFKWSVHNSDAAEGYIEDYAKLQNIDWHPLIYISGSEGYVIQGDTDNCTVINTEMLKRLHNVAVLSGYKIPVVDVIKE